MGKTEKWFMNTEKHSRKAIKKIERLINYIEIKDNQKFLEIGCGNGTACKHVAKKYKLIVTGIDVDPEQVKNATKNVENIKNIKFLEGDSTKLRFKDNEFDIVYSSGVLHHISNWMKVLEEITRVLRPNGYYIFSDLTYSRFTKRLFKNISKNYGFYTINDLLDFMNRNKFEIVKKEKSEHLFLRIHNVIFKK